MISESIYDYVTEDMIISKLCAIRSRKAEESHKKFLIHNLSHRNKQNKIARSFIYTLFPPRKDWVRLNFNNRKNLSAAERNRLSLIITIKKTRLSNPFTKPEWLINLDNYCASIRSAFKYDTYEFKTPNILPLFKEQNEDIIYRPVCLFSLTDKVILSLLNKYLTMIFDNYFYEHSYAFRSSRSNHELTHHTAVKYLKEFRRNNPEDLWVAECDMQKFYDTIDHSFIKKEFNKLLLKAKQDNIINISTTKIIKKLFYSYLHCFDFYHHIYKNNGNKSFFEQKRLPVGRFGWIEKDLADQGIFRKKYPSLRVGVPQGGALSGLIANIILNAVDKRISPFCDSEFLYIRFCDDMVMVSTDVEKLKCVFNSYQKLLRGIKLFIHKPENADSKSPKEFWNGKSKEPYMWSKLPKGRPWITFVGYDINWQGNTRVRLKSLHKEKNKQYEKIAEAYSEVRKHKANQDQYYILSSVKKRLVGMSVGRINMWDYKIKQNSLCWMNGFKELDNNQWSRKQLHSLDQNQRRMLNRLKKKLLDPNINYLEIKSKKKERKMYDPAYCGSPFSYYGQVFIYK